MSIQHLMGVGPSVKWGSSPSRYVNKVATGLTATVEDALSISQANKGWLRGHQCSFQCKTLRYVHVRTYLLSSSKCAVGMCHQYELLWQWPLRFLRDFWATEHWKGIHKLSLFYVIMWLDYRSTISLPHVCLMCTVYVVAAGCDARV